VNFIGPVFNVLVDLGMLHWLRCLWRSNDHEIHIIWKA